MNFLGGSFGSNMIGVKSGATGWRGYPGAYGSRTA